MKLEEFKPVNQYKAINWNEVSDMIDKATWEKLTEQFWLDTRIGTNLMTITSTLLAMFLVV